MNKRMNNLKGLIAQRRTRLQSNKGVVTPIPVALQTVKVLFSGGNPLTDNTETLAEEPTAEEPAEALDVLNEEESLVEEEESPVEEVEVPVEVEAPVEEVEAPVEVAQVETASEPEVVAAPEPLVEQPVEEPTAELPVEPTPVEEPSQVRIESHVEGTASFGGNAEGESSEVLPFEFGKTKRRNRRNRKEANNG